MLGRAGPGWAPRLREPRPEAPPVAGRKRRERPCRWREAAEPGAERRSRGSGESPEPRTGTAGRDRGPSGRAPGGSGSAVPVSPALCRRSAVNPGCAPLVPVPPAFVFSPFPAALPPIFMPVGAVPLPGRFLTRIPGAGVSFSRSGVTKPRSRQPPQPHRYLGAESDPSVSPPGALVCRKHRYKSCLLLNVSSLLDTSLLSEC